jgi:hypothetical protein
MKCSIIRNCSSRYGKDSLPECDSCIFKEGCKFYVKCPDCGSVRQKFDAVLTVSGECKSVSVQKYYCPSCGLVKVYDGDGNDVTKMFYEPF